MGYVLLAAMKLSNVTGPLLSKFVLIWVDSNLSFESLDYSVELLKTHIVLYVDGSLNVIQLEGDRIVPIE